MQPKPSSTIKLVSTNKPVVLIVESDRTVAETLAYFFDSRGYLVYVESDADKARSRLQVFDYTKNLVDLAFVKEGVGNSGPAFIAHLHKKYPNVKTVMIANSSAYAHDTTEAVCTKKDNLELVGDIADTSLQYNQDFLREHLQKMRKSERMFKDQEKLAKIQQKRSYSPEELAQWKDLQSRIASRLAKSLLEVLNADTIHLRKFLWKEFTHQVRLFKYELKFGKIKAMCKTYLDAQRGFAWKKNRSQSSAAISKFFKEAG